MKGIYSNIAIALKVGPWRRASLVQLAQTLSAIAAIHTSVELPRRMPRLRMALYDSAKRLRKGNRLPGLRLRRKLPVVTATHPSLAL